MSARSCCTRRSATFAELFPLEFYHLSRFDEEKVGGRASLSLILISQKYVLDMLDTASSSTFKRANAIMFDKYSAEELADIVAERATLALFPNAIGKESVSLIGDIASEFGDARFAIELLDKAGIEFMTLWVGLREAPASEQERYGYARKGGLFISRETESVDPGNAGKKVLQLNYRWPNLGNPPPLSYLIDEMVGIAQGLYLGQLLFASDILTKYDPARPSSDYRYAHYGYFLLMDESWHKKGEEA